MKKVLKGDKMKPLKEGNALEEKPVSLIIARNICMPERLFKQATELSLFTYGKRKFNLYVLEAIKEKNEKVMEGIDGK